ncbi:hypothetical protein V2J09_006125 [Rumex salicifolius]
MTDRILAETNIPKEQCEIDLENLKLRNIMKIVARWDDRVKWSLHAREEIMFEILQHLRGNAARMKSKLNKTNRRNILLSPQAH